MILIACPACDRQYDVSHVAVGSRVRCACDALIAVGAQGSLRVAALHCSHCGGAVEKDEPACRWCGAALSARDRVRSTLCPKCFTRIEDDARHCKACGVAIAPQALTPLPADRACPRCAGELVIRALGAHDVVECAACGGLWLSARVFDAICTTASAAPTEPYGAFARAASAATGPPPATTRYIPCLGCGELMLQRSFRAGGRSSGVVVDFCRGHGVWLDREELERILAFLRAAGSDRGAARADGFDRAAPAAAPVSIPPPPSTPRKRTPSERPNPWVFETFDALDLAEGAIRLLALVVIGLFNDR